jgi:hypothetical protein
MADSDSPGLRSFRAVIALLREARSLSRRAAKLGRSLAAAVNPAIQQCAAVACSSVEQLVRHLTVLERQVQLRSKAAVRRGR